ncbi:MAG: DUF1365 domain-containing protein [Sneathiellales bacterium]|nr:DUF1365 domain-containing protein [Sneathiellales bacterium]
MIPPDEQEIEPFKCYQGKVYHQRHDAIKHRLVYKVFSVCLDLTNPAKTTRDIPFFSFNRFNLFSLHEKDHMEEGYERLTEYVQDLLTCSGIFSSNEEVPARIEMLAYPRFLGRAFNPLTVFFCYGKNQEVKAILYQVRNTFGQRHHYAFKISDGLSAPYRHSCDKCFYVSPFIEMDCHYTFKITPPKETVSITINQAQQQQALLTASFRGRKLKISRKAMLALALSYFQMGGKILAAIHWEALKLWIKGAAYQQRPDPPAVPVTGITSSISNNKISKEGAS